MKRLDESMRRKIEENYQEQLWDLEELELILIDDRDSLETLKDNFRETLTEDYFQEMIFTVQSALDRTQDKIHYLKNILNEIVTDEYAQEFGLGEIK